MVSSEAEGVLFTVKNMDLSHWQNA